MVNDSGYPETHGHPVEAELLRKTVDGLREWLWSTDTQWRFTSPSPRRAKLLGTDLPGLAGKSLFDFMAADDTCRIKNLLDQITNAPRPFSGMVCRYTRMDGTILVLEVSGTPWFDSHGALTGYRGVDRDITPTGLLSMDGQTSRLERIYATLPIALCVVGRDGCLLAVNDMHGVLAGRPLSALVGMRVADLNEEGGRNVARDFRVFDADGSVPDHELVVGEHVYSVSVAPLRDMFGKVEAISVAHKEITASKVLERELSVANEKLLQLSVRDHLTGLFNRRHFDECLELAIDELRRTEGGLALLLFDIDFFKGYNDHYGHQQGDECLVCVAACARDALADTPATLFRYGGEEFVAIVPGLNEASALSLSDRLHRSIAERALEHAGSPFQRVTMSIGVASLAATTSLTDIFSSRDRIIKAADMALYRAKQEGRNTTRTGHQST